EMSTRQILKRKHLVSFAITGIVAVLAGCASQGSAPIEGIGPQAGASQEPAVQTSGLGQVEGLQGESIAQLQQRIYNASAYTPAQQQQMIAALRQISCKIVYFAFDSTKLTDQAQTCLKQVANYAIEFKQPIRLAGHTDPRGSEKYNLNLGQRRGDSVRQYLLQEGVPSNLLCTVSYGESQPAVSPQALYAQMCKNAMTKECKGEAQQKAYYLDRRVVLDFGQKCR
uniref:OmpA family protein n=1 Tax=Facilibium subflavum TaxID=2219058 RepID=UPI0013C30B9C